MEVVEAEVAAERSSERWRTDPRSLSLSPSRTYGMATASSSSRKALEKNLDHPATLFPVARARRVEVANVYTRIRERPTVVVLHLPLRRGGSVLSWYWWCEPSSLLSPRYIDRAI